MNPISLLATVRAFFPANALSIGEHLQKELGLYSLLGRETHGAGYETKALYLIVSDMDVDSDGSHLPGDATSQPDTSLHDTHGHALDANAVPWFVLPGHWQHGVKLGDYGIAWTKSYASAFIVGDVGPTTKISEGSLELARRLGHERVRSGRVVDASMGEIARVLLFPGSGSGVFSSVPEIEAKAAALLTNLTK